MSVATSKQSAYGTTYGDNAAENYEQYFVPVIGRPFGVDLVADAALQPGERVLDVACGTGIVARLAAAGSGPVLTPGDISPGRRGNAGAPAARGAPGVAGAWALR